jgi:hypothetical protein
MATIYRNVNGSFTTLNSVDLVAMDVFDFTAMEASADGTEARGLKPGSNEMQISTIQNDTTVADETFDLTATAEAGADGAKNRVGEAGSTMADTESKVDGMFACTEAPGMDFFFQASEPTTAQGQPLCYLRYTLDRANEPGDGMDDLATYQPDTIGPGESFTFTLDPREAAIITEYAIFL